MKLLDHIDIARKIKRMAIQILEQNYQEPEIILAGINKNGTAFAELLFNEFTKKFEQKLTLTTITLNPANPLTVPIEVGLPIEYFENKVIIVVDDVANTGRTIFYAIKPFLDIIPKKIEVAVLVDRKHKSFPIMVDYMGMSLATTLQENIEVSLKDKNEYSVMLN
jgi:pyrimidine operon attenuation protein/uracil phosphoribosyltransferase